jgi:hypothetical protein
MCCSSGGAQGKWKKRMKLKFFLNLIPVWPNSGLWCRRFPYFIGPCPHRDTDYRIGSNFWKFYLIRTGELGFLVKVFRLFRSERSFLVFRVCTQCTTSYLLAGLVCSWCLVDTSMNVLMMSKLLWKKSNLDEVQPLNSVKLS